MYLTLNIGLAVAGATEPLAERVVLDLVRAAHFVVHQHVVVQSDTEPTLVVTVFEPWANVGLPAPGVRLLRLARDLQQDCIACWSPKHERGSLIGPQAAKWGEFNPEFFFTLDGKRLSEALARKAA